MSELEEVYVKDSHEFELRCLHCGIPRCNVHGSENMERCIMRNGLNFEDPPNQYAPRKQKIIVPLLQTLPTGTDWRKQA